MKFRKDINGLRAYAVLLVMLYHFGIYPFSGGFLGVDIFFVISGYLMTGIILAKKEAGLFSPAGFYLSRCKRIVPPLLVMCAVLLALGYALTPPAEFRIMAKHALSSLLFISNLLYYKESGYFDAGALYKWLLHTWSLSVEWQFYLVLPLLMMFIARVLNRKYLLYISVAACVSFGFAMAGAIYKPSLNYFNFATRAWEMMAGGIVYMLPRANRHYRYLPGISLLVIVICSVTLTSSVAWPGPVTLIPVLATAAILYYGGDESLFLRTTMAQSIGRWSYSIYLYHWPLLVLAELLRIERTLPIKIGMMLVAIFIGFLSWLLVERKGAASVLSRPRWLCAAFVLCVSASLAIFLKQGLPEHAPRGVVEISALASDTNKKAVECFVFHGKTSPECIFNKNGVVKGGRVKLVVIGDSHALAVLSSVVASIKKPEDYIVYIAQSSCPAVPGIIRDGRRTCGEFMSYAFKTAREKYRDADILIANRFSLYLHGESGAENKNAGFHFPGEQGTFSTFFRHFADGVTSLAANQHVYILAPLPDYPYNVVSRLSRNVMLGYGDRIAVTRDSYQQRSADIHTVLQNLADSVKNVTVLDPAPWLCDAEYCYGSRNGKPIYRDSNHLSEKGNKLLVPLFQQIWE